MTKGSGRARGWSRVDLYLPRHLISEVLAALPPLPASPATPSDKPKADRGRAFGRRLPALPAAQGRPMSDKFHMLPRRLRAPARRSLDFPLGLEGLLTNPGTPGGKDGGEANPTELHAGVQGPGG